MPVFVVFGWWRDVIEFLDIHEFVFIELEPDKFDAL
jgi:hypothetical protein